MAIMYRFDEKKASENEVILQENLDKLTEGLTAGELDLLDTILDYDNYDTYYYHSLRIPEDRSELMKINMGIIIFRFALTDDILSEFTNGVGIWDDKFWEFSGLSPAALKLIAGFYAGWEYSDIILQGAPDTDISYLPEFRPNGEDEQYIVLNEKCKKLYKEIYES